MSSTIARLLSQLRFPVLQETISNLTSRVTSLESGYQQEVEVLWSGTAGTNGQVITLNRNLTVGDVLFLQHTDAQKEVSYLTPIKSIASGRYVRFLCAGSINTLVLTSAAANTITFYSFTAGYGVSSVNAIKIVKK